MNTKEIRQKIKEFKKSQDLILEIEHTKTTNSLYEWTKIRHPAMFIWNAAITKLCKYLPIKTKIYLLKNLTGMKIGKNVGMAPETTQDYFYPELITIKDNAIIGMKVNILCHEFTQTKIRLGKVIIEKGCLIGAFTNIRSGVVIGENSIVAMNSFVNKNIPPNEVWGGVPAKFIKKIK